MSDEVEEQEEEPVPPLKAKARPGLLVKTEVTRILEWRALQLGRAGAPPVVAAALATTDHDLHVMCDAFEAGISVETATALWL